MEEKLVEYKELDRAYVKGRGTVIVVENDKDRFRSDNDLVGSQVLIDGFEYKVKGLESFVVDKIYKGQNIGLLV